MTNPAERLADLHAHVAREVGDLLVSASLHSASDTSLADSVALAGDLLRLVEAVLIDGVGDLAERSRSLSRDERLTSRLGCHDLNELVQRLTRCSAATASKLGKAQKAVAIEWDPIGGDARPAPLPALRTAMLHGDVGVDGVLAIAGPLLAMGDRVSREQVLLADEILAAQARGEGPDAAPPACADLLKLQAQVWAVALDQDGAEPAERDSAFHRGVTLGRARNGIIPIHGGLMAEVAAQLQRIFDSVGAPRAGRVTFDDPDKLGLAEETDAADGAFLDDRSRAQRQHDALAMALSVAAATRDLPTIGGAAPTLIVSVREQDLGAEDAWAHAEGVEQPLTMKAARHVACSGVIQRVVLGGDGRILRLGTEERVFNRHQRRAIGLRDGGCIIPGCNVPLAWCEIHHVLEHAEGGPTHTDNGVPLCWHHHRFIDSGPWRIRMNRGVPEVQAPSWFDPSMRWRPVTKARTRMLDLIELRT
jgi:hypothetical protein